MAKILDGKAVAAEIRSEVEAKAARISPVPGGVGPMTRAMLMYNTFEAARTATDGLHG